MEDKQRRRDEDIQRQVDADECVTEHHACHVFATCNNTISSYTCQCNEGWTGNGKHCSGNELFLETTLFTFITCCKLLFNFHIDIMLKRAGPREKGSNDVHRDF